MLTELGVRMVFHKVAQRPGKPLWFGVAQSGPAVFALPGNPVSTLVCSEPLRDPGAARGDGRNQSRGAQDSAGGAGHRQRRNSCSSCRYAPKWTTGAGTGQYPAPTNGSGDFTALAGTDGFVELPAGPNTYPKGFVTRLFRW